MLRPRFSPTRLAFLVGALAGLAVLATLRGPGITTDEPLDVRPGRTYVQTLLKKGLGFFEPATIITVFRDNAEHPPLGRWLLGIASTVGQPFETLLFGGDPLNLYVWSGRLAPASIFAALVGLITQTSARRYGNPAGAAAGFALAVMPRVFAHAHLGALDTFIAFFWTLALLATDRALTSRRPVVAMIGAGALWSLALLTKIHAWFLIPIVAVWAVVRLRGLGRACAAFGAWMVTGLGLFVLGWPWLWHDTIGRLSAYAGTGVVRSSIRVLYFGTVYDDSDVPWHYPWVYFAVTVPIGLHVFGLIGLARAWKERRTDPFPGLLLGSIGLVLVLFSTRVPVYDGERLFLTVFPLWAIFIGRGFGEVWAWARGHNAWRGAALALLAAQTIGIITLHPFELSYYNALVGGLPGAERLGLELTYWGDAVDPVLLDDLVRVAPPDARVALAPTLYPGQGVATTTRAMARRGLIPGDQESVDTARWLLVSRRTAYWPPGFAGRIVHGRIVAVRSRLGVWLSALVQVDTESQPQVKQEIK